MPFSTIMLLTTVTYSCAAFFLGGSPELCNEAVVYSTQDRQRLRTEATGTVHLRLGIILRNFEKFGVEVG